MKILPVPSATLYIGKRAEKKNFHGGFYRPRLNPDGADFLVPFTGIPWGEKSWFTMHFLYLKWFRAKDPRALSNFFMPTSHPRHSIISSLYHEGCETWGMKIKNDTPRRRCWGRRERDWRRGRENRREKLPNFPIAIARQLSRSRARLVEIFVVGPSSADRRRWGRKWVDRNAKRNSDGEEGGEEV